jgi:hypothetical protein
MNFQNATEVFGLPPLAATVSAAFPFDPLDLVAIEDVSSSENVTPKLVVSYDWWKRKRIETQLPRHTSFCTHVFVTILPGVGAPPVTAGFSAACLAEVFENGTFRKIHPNLQKQAIKVFGALEGLLPILKVRHPHLLHCVPGCVVKEVAHVADSFMSVDLRTDAQVDGALAVIEQWQSSPPDYEVRSTKGKNCHDFVRAVIAGANIRPPHWWGLKPWPGTDARIIEYLCGEKLRKSGDWVLQPRAITEIMHEAAARAAIKVSVSKPLPHEPSSMYGEPSLMHLVNAGH